MKHWPLIMVFWFVANGYLSQQYPSLAVCQKSYTPTLSRGWKTDLPDHECWDGEPSPTSTPAPQARPASQ